MSVLKFSENLFLETKELQRFQDFIFQDGWENAVKQNILQYGIVDNKTMDPTFSNFRITDGGDIEGVRTLSIGYGMLFALESDTNRLKIVRNRLFDRFQIPSDDKWYWIKVSPQVSIVENGVLSIDSEGKVVGNGTKFKEVLRGQPNFPSKIKFWKKEPTGRLTFINSQLNTEEYEILQVVDNTNLIIQGDFTPELDLYYEVIGTFTPGKTIDEENKGIFRYDDCKIELIEENSPNGTPFKPSYTKNEEFCIYRFKFNGLDLIIEDYRNETYKESGEYEIETISDKPLPNIGLIKSSFDSVNSTRVQSLLDIEWGFKSSSYEINTSSRILTLNQGSGGKYKSTNQFIDGDFDNWNVLLIENSRNDNSDDFYSRIERVFKINSSSKNDSVINLVLDHFSKIDFKPYDYSSTTSYKNGDKVNTANGTYELKLSSSLGLTPNGNSVYSPSETYSQGTLVSNNGDTFISLQNNNLGNDPDTSSAYWNLVWQKKTIELLVIPDCEEVIIYLSVGEDVSGLENETLQKTFTFPTILGKGRITATSINEVGSAKQNDLVYNIKYRLKNNKVVNNIKVLPSDADGYIDELGNLTSYDTQFINKAFVKSIRSVDSYISFKDRVDLGDLQGIEIITNLESLAVEQIGRQIPIEAKVNKKIIRVTGSDAFTGNVAFKMMELNAVPGNKFQINLEPIFECGSNHYYVLLTNEANETLLTVPFSNLRNGNQIVWCERYATGWFCWLEDNSFDGHNHFTQGEYELINVQEEVVSESGKEVLYISGKSNNIYLRSSGSIETFDYIKSKNGRLPNILNITSYGNLDNYSIWNVGSSSVDTAAGLNYGTGYNYLNETASSLNLEGRNTFILSQNPNFGYVGYDLFINPKELKDRMKNSLSPVVGRNVIADGTYETSEVVLGTLTLPDNDLNYEMILIGSSNLQTTGQLALYFGAVLADVSQCDGDSKHSCFYLQQIQASGQVISIKALCTAGGNFTSAKIQYILIPLEL